MTIKAILKAALRSAGFQVSRFPANSLEDCVAFLLQKERIDLVLDVGAYNGEYSRSLRDDIGYTGKIVSFEPCTASFQALSSSMSSDLNWTGKNYGLSDQDAIGMLNTFENSGNFNSILQLRDSDARIFGMQTDAKAVEEIQLRRLDSVWAEIVPVGSPRVFLKIDTQGHDSAVMMGAGSCLDCVVGIQVEMPAIEIYDGMTSMHEMLRLCSECGFIPIGFYSVGRPREYGGIALEYDVVLKRRSRDP